MNASRIESYDLPNYKYKIAGDKQVLLLFLPDIFVMLQGQVKSLAEPALDSQ